MYPSELVSGYSCDLPRFNFFQIESLKFQIESQIESRVFQIELLHTKSNRDLNRISIWICPSLFKAKISLSC